MAGARVCLAWWLVGWEGRGLVAARVLCLMLVCLTGWVVLLAGAAGAADAGLLVVRREVPGAAAAGPEAGAGPGGPDGGRCPDPAAPLERCGGAGW